MQLSIPAMQLDLILSLACGFALVACSSTGVDSGGRDHGVYPQGAFAATQVEALKEEWVDENFDWQVQGPFEFLELLKRGQLEGVMFPCYTVRGVHRGWIQEADVSGLLELGESTEPCLAVVMGTSSFLPMEASTVGQEALFMVLAFLEGELGLVYGGYPARLTSTSTPLDREELAARWAKRPPG